MKAFEDEVLITPQAAEQPNLRVGSRLIAAGLSADEGGKGAWDPAADHPRYEFRVSGIGLFTEDGAGPGGCPFGRRAGHVAIVHDGRFHDLHGDEGGDVL
jgi:hypothetical protein